MKKQYIFRGCTYLAGMLTLVMGLTLNTKAGLGVSAIISVPYSISEIWNLNFGNVTFIVYGLFVLVQMVLHVMTNKRNTMRGGEVLAHANRTNLKLIFIMDVLQLPLSLVFTRLLNLFNRWIPEFKAADPRASITGLCGSFFLLLLALLLTGVGAALTLGMRVIPNPGDGIVQAIADYSGKSVGFTKNCFDLLNICITVSIGILFQGKIVGAGIGTVLAVVLVGRVIAVFSHFFMDSILEKAGIHEIKK